MTECALQIVADDLVEALRGGNRTMNDAYTQLTVLLAAMWACTGTSVAPIMVRMGCNHLDQGCPGLMPRLVWEQGARVPACMMLTWRFHPSACMLQAAAMIKAGAMPLLLRTSKVCGWRTEGA